MSEEDAKKAGYRAARKTKEIYERKLIARFITVLFSLSLLSGMAMAQARLLRQSAQDPRRESCAPAADLVDLNTATKDSS